VDGLQRVPRSLAQLRDFKASVGRIAAAVVKEIADVVRLEDFNQPFILRPVFLQAFELVAAGAEGAGWRGQQTANGGRALLAGIDQVFAQRTDDTVAACIDFADLYTVLASSFDNAAGRGVDDGSDATGLGVEGVFSWHVVVYSW
jgi:hypothetical protein